MRSAHDIILRPVLTEKAMQLKEKENKIVVEVARDANKIEIKNAFEALFNVKVEKVATVNIKPKKKRLGRFEGRTRAWKKAIITLKKGEKLDFIEGV
ncbi:MAG: 50S ribosomal protein L23 [Nitrospirae bacterium]|nr:MAG: 50S ribosomal protein L23 [Nitrospirota bacterium]